MTRCPIRPTDPGNGQPVETVACCRLADHDGQCHRHFNGLTGVQPHTTVHRATRRAIRCSAGEALDNP